MASKIKIELTRKEIIELEKLFKKKVEFIVFNTRRSKPKKKGGHKIKDNTGELRRVIRSANNFIKQDTKGININFPVTEYYKYLDDARIEELNWYLSEAIFEDKDIRDKMKELYAKSGQRAILKMLEI